MSQASAPAPPYPLQLSTRELACHRNALLEYHPQMLLHQTRLLYAYRPLLELLQQQPEVLLPFRAKLIEFLFKIASRLRVLPFVPHRAVRLFDRYCSKRIVLADQAQLVVCTCLWLACKTNGGFHQPLRHRYTKLPVPRTEGPTTPFRLPRLLEFVKLCGRSCNYDEGMFVQMELHVLLTLEWSVEEPGIDDFLLLETDFQQEMLDDARTMEFLAYVTLFIPEFVDLACVQQAQIIGNMMRAVLGAPPVAQLSCNMAPVAPAVPVAPANRRMLVPFLPALPYSPAQTWDDSDLDWAALPATQPTPLPLPALLVLDGHEAEPGVWRRRLVDGILENFNFFYTNHLFSPQVQGIKTIIQRAYDARVGEQKEEAKWSGSLEPFEFVAAPPGPQYRKVQGKWGVTTPPGSTGVLPILNQRPRRWD